MTQLIVKKWVSGCRSAVHIFLVMFFFNYIIIVHNTVDYNFNSYVPGPKIKIVCHCTPNSTYKYFKIMNIDLVVHTVAYLGETGGNCPGASNSEYINVYSVTNRILNMNFFSLTHTTGPTRFSR